jgi:hypothetical protein
MRRASAVVVVMISCLIGGLLDDRPVSAQECSGGSLRANLISQGTQAKLSISSKSYQCRLAAPHHKELASGSFYTYETLCNPSSQRGPGTLCSVAPCINRNQSFALRNLRHADGREDPAGFVCLNPSQAIVSPGITLAQVYEAIRNVRLPGGKVRAVPAIRGLTNLKSYFWLEGASQEPVQLSLAESILYAEFRVVEYRWSFGGGEPLVTEGPGTPGLESEVNTTFRRRGVYPVEVTVMWAAEAFLDGRRVEEVDDLVSRAEMSYPVAELRTVLTG